MGDPQTRVKRSSARKRNFLVKKMRETGAFKKKIHETAKDREKQRKWRIETDSDGDYEMLDDWLTHTENF